MKKSVFFASVALLAVLVASLMISTVHVTYGQSYKDGSACDHWDEGDRNTDDDIFTATGIRAWYSGQVFTSATFWFTCGSGGNHLPHPSYDTSCYWKYAHDLWTWFGPYYYAYYGDFYSADPFPYDGEDYVYEYYREYNPTYYFDWAHYVRGLSINWFQHPENHQVYITIGSTWATVST